VVHRKPLLDLIERYRAEWPDEAAVAERVRALVAAHPDCFERRCAPGHVTGSAFVVSPDLRRCLLVHHRKLDRWLQPGGHADGEGDLAAVALREAREETGLAGLSFATGSGEPLPFDLDVHQIPALGGEPAHEHHDVRFLLIADPAEPPRASDESHAARWFDLDELPAEESLARMARKLRARR